MQVRKGYLLLENIISIAITGIILTTLYGVLFLSLNMYRRIHSTIEIQQQGIEIQNSIEKELKEDIEIRSIKTSSNQTITSSEFESKDVISIKYKPVDRPDNQGLDEIYLNNKAKKVFIKRKNASSGYEIGDYLDNIYIEKAKDDKIINIKLKLSKDNQHHNVKFSI